MQIKNMFEKPIDRDIKGVIKVGQSDEENIYQELDEYVVTKELLRHFIDQRLNFFARLFFGKTGDIDRTDINAVQDRIRISGCLFGRDVAFPYGQGAFPHPRSRDRGDTGQDEQRRHDNQ